MNSSFADRRFQSFFRRPSRTKAIVQDKFANACNPRPLCYSKVSAVVLNKATASPVVALFLLRRPSAVFRAIVSVIVNALNGMISAWSLAHIRKKVFKHIPSFAYSNSTPAVVFVSRFICVAATVAKSTPNIMFRRVALAVFCLVYLGCLVMPATTAFAASAPKSVAVGHIVFSAIAHATPEGFSFGSPSIEDHAKPAEPLTSEVFESRVIRDRMGFSHGDASVQVSLWSEPASVSALVPARFIITHKHGVINAE